MAKTTTRGVSARAPNQLPQAAMRNTESIAFAGILVSDDGTTVSIADVQGTWLISRKDVIEISPWEPNIEVPPHIPALGKPVQVQIRRGVTINEVRPWFILDRDRPIDGPDVEHRFKKVFTLGGEAPLPVDFGDQRLRALELAFGRNLGWQLDSCTDGRVQSGIRNAECTTTGTYRKYDCDGWECDEDYRC